MSLLRMILVGSYMAGVAALLLAFAMRLGLSVVDLSPRGVLTFSIACFLCALATGEVEAHAQKPKPSA